MPVFFLVGGCANLAAWDRAGGSARAVLRRRLTRLLRPAADRAPGGHQLGFPGPQSEDSRRPS